MPKTIAEILDSDLGLGAEKTAAVATTNEVNDIEKLATEIGLYEKTNVQSQEQGHNKEASMSMTTLLNEMFPGDAGETAQVKTASITKEAAEVQEAMGEVARDAFAAHVQNHICKIAAELVSAEVRADDHPQKMENNEVKDGKPIDTKPVVQDQLMGTNPKGTVGEFENKEHPNGEQVKAAAARKALIMSQLEK